MRAIHLLSLVVFVATSSAGARGPASAEAAPPRVGIVAVPAGEGGWLSERLAETCAENAQRLGVDAAVLTAGAEASAEIVVSVEVAPAATADPSETLTVRIQSRTGKAKMRPSTEQLAAFELDGAGARCAFAVLAAAGQTPDPIERAFILERKHPFEYHRQIGQAWLEENRGQFRAAYLKYERAEELAEQGLYPEALGRAFAMKLALSTDHERVRSDADLAEGALERGREARRRKQWSEAVSGFRAYLRYTPARAQPFAVELDLPPSKSTVLASEEHWYAQGPSGSRLVDRRTGRSRSVEAPRSGRAVGLIGAELLVLSGRTLSRIDPTGRPRWTLELPFEPAPGPVTIAGGMGAVLGADQMTWVDLGLGSLGQRASKARPLAAGPEGVLVVVAGKGKKSELALLRPGREHPTWSVEIDEPRQARLSRGRALVIDRRGAWVLDSRDGKTRLGPLAVSKDAHWIGADRRYATLADAAGSLELLDILAGERGAKLIGPGRAIGSRSNARGVTVAYESGDVVSFDRDGHALDRGRVPGRPWLSLDGSPTMPSALIVSDRGLYAIGDPGNAERPRDVVVLVELAHVLADAGQVDGALRLADHVAFQSLGCVAPMESLRAELLGRRSAAGAKAMAEQARARAKAAADVRTPLPSYAIIKER